MPVVGFNELLAIAFGMWAGVVGWLGHGIRVDLRRIGQELRQESDKLNQYIIATERRMAVLEDRVLRQEKLNGNSKRQDGNK